MTRRPDKVISKSTRYDEAWVGRVFRWSTLLVVCVGVLIAAIVFFQKRSPAPEPEQVTTLAAPSQREVQPVEPPTVRFTDITRDAGIQFTHVNGARGDKLLPETMGGGAAFLDYDNDGDADLLLVNSAHWPWDEPTTDGAATMVLYRNDGTGRYSDVTRGSGLDIEHYGMGAAVGDYDNDSHVDVLITGVGGNRLFHNEGDGRFADVTADSGVAGRPEDWSTCAAWFDADNDGDLDLFVGNYVRWSRDIDFEVGYTLVGLGRAYGPPSNFEGAFPYLFINDGNGRFRDASAESGVQIRNTATGVPVAKPLGVSPVDVNGDAWMDLLVANDTVQNFLFLNQCDGTFKEQGAASGVAFDSYGNARGAMGIDTGWFRNDDKLGIAIGNFANEMTALYVAQNAPTQFADEAIAAGIGPASRRQLKFGIFFFDYDLDGWLDLLSANGHLEEEIQQIQQSQSYAQPAQLFWNAHAHDTPHGFIEVTSKQAGTDLFTPMVGRGSAYADIDGDGDLDVLITQVAGRPLLLRNEQALAHHWLRVRLVGTHSNRDGIGARVRVKAGELTLTRQVMPTRGYLSQSELPITFGLGKNKQVEEMTIVWPGGATQRVGPIDGDQLVTVRQEEVR